MEGNFSVGFLGGLCILRGKEESKVDRMRVRLRLFHLDVDILGGERGGVCRFIRVGDWQIGLYRLIGGRLILSPSMVLFSSILMVDFPGLLCQPLPN